MAKGWGIVQDSQGNAIESCEVKVYLAGTSTLASIFSDSALSVAIDQTNSPVATDDKGKYEFYVATGTYKLIGTKGTFTFTEDNVDIGYSVSAVDPPLTLTGATVGFDAFFDVRAYGAVGDGSTDDTTSIQAALDALGAAGGGTLLIPTGQFNVSAQIDVPANVLIEGVGYASRIHMTTVDTQIFSLSGVDKVGFSKLRLTGQGGFVTAGLGAIRLGEGGAGNGTLDSWVRDCWIEGTSNCGITISSVSKRCRVTNVRVDGAGEEGIYLLGDECSIVGCTVSGSGQSGIKVSTAVQPTVVGNHSADNGQYGLLISGATVGGVVAGNTILRSGNDGIRVADSATDVAIAGNHIEASSQGADDTDDNILVNGASVARIFIDANTCRIGSETNGPRYGLAVSTATDTIVGTNDLRSGGRTGQYLDSATNTQGVRLKARQQPATADTSIVSTSDTDITGCSIAVTPLLSQVVVVHAMAEVNRVVAGATLFLVLDVNGSNQAARIKYLDSARDMVAGVWVLSLTGGTAYTIKLQGLLSASGGGERFDVYQTNTQIALVPAGGPA